MRENVGKWCKLQDKLYIALLAAPSVSNVNVLTVAQQKPNGGWLNRAFARAAVEWHNLFSRLLCSGFIYKPGQRTKNFFKPLSRYLSISLMFGEKLGKLAS